MNLRWLWLDHFPPGINLTRAERKTATRLALKLRSHRPRYRNAHRTYFTHFLPILILFVVLQTTVNQKYLIGTNAALFAAGLGWAMYKSFAPFLRRALCVLGHRTCVDCGYILRGLGDDVAVCPGCGADHSDDCPHCGCWLGGIQPAAKKCPGCGSRIRPRRGAWADLGALRKLGYNVCPGCGTWLRETVDQMPTCPECDLQRDYILCHECAAIVNDTTTPCPQCGHTMQRSS